jgi:hypothetical protein
MKFYNKLRYFLRVETTINDPKALNLKKPLCYLKAYYWKGLESNNRFYNCCADVDRASLPDEKIEEFNQPVEDKTGKKITPPDPRKGRQIALQKELLKPKYSVYGFTTHQLLGQLRPYFRNSAQIRYEITKLRARQIIEKRKHQSFYVVTQQGYKWLWVTISSVTCFRNPIISRGYQKELYQVCAQPSKLEEAYTLIDSGLSQLTQELALVA